MRVNVAVTLNSGKIILHHALKFAPNAALYIGLAPPLTVSATWSATTMSQPSTKNRPKNKRSKRPAGLGGERGKKRLQLGCPTFKCKGTCRYVYVGDEVALQCPTCGVFLRCLDGVRPWFFPNYDTE